MVFAAMLPLRTTRDVLGFVSITGTSIATAKSALPSTIVQLASMVLAMTLY